jgi:ABC-type lipoprotein export system ATPase subunit
MPGMFKSNDDPKQSYQHAVETLILMGLAGKKDVYPKQLSAGEQKRVVISRALINNPEIILADEPTSDLDTKTEQEVMALLREINSRGVTIIMVTHSLQLLPCASRAFEMEDGKLNAMALAKIC